jgi:hypothetical protein
MATAIITTFPVLRDDQRLQFGYASISSGMTYFAPLLLLMKYRTGNIRIAYD